MYDTRRIERNHHVKFGQGPLSRLEEVGSTDLVPNGVTLANTLFAPMTLENKQL